MSLWNAHRLHWLRVRWQRLRRGVGRLRGHLLTLRSAFRVRGRRRGHTALAAGEQRLRETLGFWQRFGLCHPASCGL